MGLIAVAYACFFVLAGQSQIAAQHEQRQLRRTYYVVKDLGTLGGTVSVAEGISDRGWIVGSAYLAGDQSEHAYLWRDGVKTDLGTLGGPNSNEQWPVKDNRGLIAAVGETSNPDPLGENFCGFNTGLTCLGFLWQDGQKTPLPTLGGNNGQALGVNNRGQVVGYAENNIQDPNCVAPQVLDVRAVVWGPKAGEIQQLPPLPGDTISAATGINDREQVVGVSGLCSDTTARGVLWQDGTVIDLGNLGGVLNTIPWAINAQGKVVGQSDITGDATLHAFLWNNGDGMQDLGALPGDSASLAFGINANGRVVGGSCVDATLSSCRAFLWQNGVMTDLNTLVKPGSTPLYLFFGNDINSRGEIAFFAFNQSNGEYHAAMGVPCDADHANVEGCEEQSTGADIVPVTSERPRVILPENVRKQLQQRRHGPMGAYESQTDNVDFLHEQSQIDFNSAGAGPQTCRSLGSSCTSSKQCCNNVCGRLTKTCCNPFHNQFCTSYKDCCSGACISNRCE